MNKIIVCVIVVLVGLWSYMVGWQIGATKYHTEFFQYWSDDCRQDGGSVQITSPKESECFKNGEIINHVK